MRLLNNTHQIYSLLGEETSNSSNANIKNVTIDSRLVKKDSLFFGIEGTNTHGGKFAKQAIGSGASLVISDIANNSLKNNYIHVQDVPKAMQAIAKSLMQNYEGAVIGLTGSNGKTTVKNLLSKVVSRSYASPSNLNNEIGLPLSVMGLSGSDDTAIFEMGAARPGDIELLADIIRPDIGIITSIGKSHLKGMKSIEGVLKTKSELIYFIKPGGHTIIPLGDYTEYWKSLRSDINFITFGTNSDADIFIKNFEMNPFGLSFEACSNLSNSSYSLSASLLGQHNALNILIAFACNEILENDIDDFKKNIESFKNFSNRLSPLPWINNSVIINDSYNANPDSTKEGCITLSKFTTGRKIILLGDMLDLGDKSDDLHREIGKFARKLKIDCLLGFGKKAELSVAHFGKNGKFFKDEIKLRQYLKNNVQKGDTIYLKGSRGMKMERFLEND